MKLQFFPVWNTPYFSAYKLYCQPWIQLQRQVLICSMFNLILLKKITKS